MNILSEKILHNIEAYAQEFQTAAPYPHIVIDDFLNQKAWSELLAEFPSHETRDGIIGDYGEVGAAKGGKSNVRDFGDAYKNLDDIIKSEEFLSMIAKISGIDNLLYDPDYIGGGIHENFPGLRNRIHIDYNYHPKTNYHRRLNLLIYLTPEWKAEYGGGIKVYENGLYPEKGSRKIVPCLGNRCVMFETTEDSWHGVETIKLPPEVKGLTRKSIALYYYTEEREPEKTAPRHSTIYLPDSFPDNLESQRPLLETEVSDILAYRASAARLIKQLYGEHQRLYDKLGRAEQNLAHVKSIVDKARNDRDHFKKLVEKLK